MPQIDIYTKQQVDNIIENLPSGGDGWEEIDISNIPNDWENGDEVKIAVCGYYDLPSVSSWSSTFSEPSQPFNFIPSRWASKDGVRVASGYLYGDTDSTNAQDANAVLSIYDFYQAIAAQMSLRSIGSVKSFNSSETSYTLFTISIRSYNGSSSYVKSISVNKSNISTYIAHMWRKKTIA